MATRLQNVVVNTVDRLAQAEFWSSALGVEMGYRDDVKVDIPLTGLDIVFVTASDPKTVPNRLHFDLASASRVDQEATVRRLRGLGAVPVDIGQGRVPWVVLADPEGNEFCVLDPREEYRNTGPLAAVVVDAVDPSSLAVFWSAAAGWPVVHSRPQLASLRAASGQGPWVEFIEGEPKKVRNRLHFNVRPGTSDQFADEVARLRGLGAVPVDIGQGRVPWVVLADPEGNEMCVLQS